MTREPGDLPSFVVTRESVGRGAPRRSKTCERASFALKSRGQTIRSDGPRCCESVQMTSPLSRPAIAGGYNIARVRTSLLTFVFSAALVTPAFAQANLPVIVVGKPKPAPVAPSDTPVNGTPGERSDSEEVAANGDGAQIGPGKNGEICAGGLCNNPASYAAPVESLGTKINTPVMNTPVTTKMVTRQMLEDYQVITIDEALKNVSGVATSGGGANALGNSFRQIIIRGFETQNFFRDGVRVDSFGLNFIGSSSVEMANVESLEVLKGPAAILYGAVEPGGVVNINTKQPLAKPAYSVQQQIGSYNQYRTVVDATGPIANNNDLLYRFVGSYQNDRSFRNLDYARNIMINPVVRWNIDNNTWVRGSTQFHTNNFNQDWYFTPYYGMFNPLWLGRSYNWGPESPYNQQQNFTEFTVHHDINRDWSIQQTAYMQLLHSYWENFGGSTSVVDCTPNPGNFSCFNAPFFRSSLPGSLGLSYNSYPSDNRQAVYATVLDITGRFDTGKYAQHTLLSGGDYYRYNFRGQNNSPMYPGVAPFSAPQLAIPAYGLVPVNATEQYVDNIGLYLQDQIQLPAGLNILVGARYQYINSRTGTTDSYNSCGPTYDASFNLAVNIPCNFDTISKRGQFINQRVTPRAGLLWRPLEWISFYGNYAQSYSPNYNGKLVYGSDEPTPPSAGEQKEGGIKFSFFDNRLQATAAYYHLLKTNIPVGIPSSYPNANFNSVLLIGQGRSQGPELDIQGEILPGWSVNLAYANTDAIVTKSDPGNIKVQAAGTPIPFVPRNIGSLATAYEFKEDQLKGLRIGARYDYTGYLPFYHTANDGTYIYGESTPSYGIVGLFGGYEFNLDKFKVVAQLNVSNLFDKTYFTQGGLLPQNFSFAHPGGYAPPYTNPVQEGWNMPGVNNNVLGTPRMFRGSIKVSF